MSDSLDPLPILSGRQCFESMRLAIMDGEIFHPDFFDASSADGSMPPLRFRVSLGDASLVSKRCTKISNGIFPIQAFFTFPYGNQPSFKVEAIGGPTGHHTLASVSVDVSPASVERSILITHMPMSIPGDPNVIWGKFAIRVEFGFDKVELKTRKLADTVALTELKETAAPVLSPVAATATPMRAPLILGCPPYERFQGDFPFDAVRVQILLAAGWKGLGGCLRLRCVVGDHSLESNQIVLTAKSGDARVDTEFDFPFSKEKRIYLFAHAESGEEPIAVASFNTLQMADNGVVSCRQFLTCYGGDHAPRGFLEVKTEFTSGIPEPIIMPIITETYSPELMDAMSPSVDWRRNRPGESPTSPLRSVPVSPGMLGGISKDSAQGCWFFDYWKSMHCVICRARDVSPAISQFKLSLSIGDFCASVPRHLVPNSLGETHVWCGLALPYRSQRQAKLNLRGLTREGNSVQGMALVDLDPAIYTRRLNVIIQIVTADTAQRPLCYLDLIFAPSKTADSRCRVSYLTSAQISATSRMPIDRLGELNPKQQFTKSQSGTLYGDNEPASPMEEIRFEAASSRFPTEGMWEPQRQSRSPKNASFLRMCGMPNSSNTRSAGYDSPVSVSSSGRMRNPNSVPGRSRAVVSSPSAKFSLNFLKGCEAQAPGGYGLTNPASTRGATLMLRPGTCLTPQQLAEMQRREESIICAEERSQFPGQPDLSCTSNAGGRLCYGPASYSLTGEVTQAQFAIACQSVREHSVKWPVASVDLRSFASDVDTNKNGSQVVHLSLRGVRDVVDMHNTGILNYLFYLTYGSQTALTGVSSALTTDANFSADLYVYLDRSRYALLHAFDASVRNRLHLIGTAVIDLLDSVVRPTDRFGEAGIKVLPLCDMIGSPDRGSGVVAVVARTLPSWPRDVSQYRLAEISSADPLAANRSCQFTPLLLRESSSAGSGVVERNEDVSNLPDRLTVLLSRTLNIPNPFPYQRFDILCEVTYGNCRVRTPVVSRGGSNAILNYLIRVPCSRDLLSEACIEVIGRDINGAEQLLAAGLVRADLALDGSEHPMQIELVPKIELVQTLERPPVLIGAISLDNRTVRSIECKRIPMANSPMTSGLMVAA